MDLKRSIDGEICPRCFVSNGVLTVWDSPDCAKCVRRCDTGRAYIPSLDGKTEICDDFTFGGPVLPRCRPDVRLLPCLSWSCC